MGRDILDFLLKVADKPQALELFAFLLVGMGLYFWGRNQNAQNQINRGLLKQNEKLTERGIAANEKLATSIEKLAVAFTDSMNDLKSAVAVQSKADAANTRAVLGYIESALSGHTREANSRYDSVLMAIGMLTEGFNAGRSFMLTRVHTIDMRLNRLEHHIIGLPIETESGLTIMVSPAYTRFQTEIKESFNEFS